MYVRRYRTTPDVKPRLAARQPDLTRTVLAMLRA
ncbi:hypothetical protein ACVWW1_005666 [Bradyrhizobium sp. JR3.5]